MPLGLQKKFVIAFGLLIFISVGNFGLLWVVEQNAEEQQEWVVHTQQVIHESEAFLGHIRDAETGQRGFLLTGKSEYLDPYITGITKAKETFERLQNLTQDNFQQQARLKSLLEVMQKKFGELKETIELTNENNLNKALVIVNSGIGKNFMDVIRTELQEFAHEENHLLSQRQIHFENSKNNVKLLMVGEVIFLIFFIFLIAIVIQQRLVYPLSSLTECANNLVSGKAFNMPKYHSIDEMGELVSAFQEMSQSINTAMDDLSQA